MRKVIVTGTAAAVVLIGAMTARYASQGPGVIPLPEAALREFAGVYRWGPNAYVYLQLWNEFSGMNQLLAFDESGDIRTLYPTAPNSFFAGPAIAVSTTVESRIEFARDATGKIVSLTWGREGAPPRIARRIESERHENVRFTNGDVQLAGTLTMPVTGEKHPALILVHGSGPQNRESVLPFARFLVRNGIAILGYDKRGVGGSTGNWNTASFEDLAGDVVAAFEYLKTRSDIDTSHIGMLGVSQAGWVMPLAAVRAKEFTFLISVSGPSVPAAETTIDHAQNEMAARGMQSQTISDIIAIMRLQNEFARTGQGWGEYLTAREQLVSRLGAPPPGAYPDTMDHPYWQFMRRIYFHDPAPTLRQLQAPTLALFGELDNNVLAEKNRSAWDAALRAGGHPDYSLMTLAGANHIHLEAKIGSNAEMPLLRRFVPSYFTTIRDWLSKRIPGFRAQE